MPVVDITPRSLPRSINTDYGNIQRAFEELKENQLRREEEETRAREITEARDFTRETTADEQDFRREMQTGQQDFRREMQTGQQDFQTRFAQVQDSLARGRTIQAHDLRRPFLRTPQEEDQAARDQFIFQREQTSGDRQSAIEARQAELDLRREQMNRQWHMGAMEFNRGEQDAQNRIGAGIVGSMINNHQDDFADPFGPDATSARNAIAVATGQVHRDTPPVIPGEGGGGGGNPDPVDIPALRAATMAMTAPEIMNLVKKGNLTEEQINTMVASLRPEIRQRVEADIARLRGGR